jgi:hypothetical protein
VIGVARGEVFIFDLDRMSLLVRRTVFSSHGAPLLETQGADCNRSLRARWRVVIRVIQCEADF